MFVEDLIGDWEDNAMSILLTSGEWYKEKAGCKGCEAWHNLVAREDFLKEGYLTEPEG